jgi:hypothetical protein
MKEEKTMTMKERMMARISRRTVQGFVRFLMELGAILFATVGIQLAFYFLDGPGFLVGCVQGVFLACGYHAWQTAQKWRRGITTLATDSTKDGTAIVVMRTNEDGTRDVLHSWWCPNRESNTAIAERG